MLITSTLQLFIRSLAPSPTTAPFDSCHGRVSGSTKFVSYVPPTAVVKLLRHSGLGSNTGMGFHPMNDLHQCFKTVRLFVWISRFVSKQWGLFLYWLTVMAGNEV